MRHRRLARRFTRLTPKAKYSKAPRNGDSHAIPIHEIDVPMFRLFSRMWTVTPAAMTTCAPAAISPTSQARSASRTMWLAQAIALIVLAVMSMISSIWAFSITSGGDIAIASPDWRTIRPSSKALVKAA